MLHRPVISNASVPCVMLGGFLLITCLSLTGLATRPAYGQSEAAASYSPGARSATTANTMLDSVVGNRHSRIKSQTTATGEIYHVASNGTVTAPNGLIVNPGCQAPLNKGAPASHAKYRFALGHRGKGFETVVIGVSDQPAPAFDLSDHPHTIRRATLSASFAPTGLYVLPSPCKSASTSDRALTMDAASALASADGNIFTLAGNRAALRDADTARPLPGGDVQLTSTTVSAQPSSPAQPTP
ncbi:MULTISPECIES: hypothetical protein [unclassified Saccharibacter]|uniref:hypothetical protein n=1 Tax=unclassified Saccharibacter TaxID=2648722 RepID=UPI00132A1811|nr:MULTISPECIES: hypothetical protein [unclassified Saccharibacter]MXV35547.1 hypothetical protein [Saccharibacter sp. EH611]MXV58908.1 hypothetical protein [Saccharibacter sp. EH70]MXV65564.1 hypothetical protein [Saccharibacter sp. EH60]